MKEMNEEEEEEEEGKDKTKKKIPLKYGIHKKVDNTHTHEVEEAGISLAISPYSTSYPALTFTHISGVDCSTYGVFAGFRTRIRHFDSSRGVADRLR